MATHEEYLDDYNTNMVFIATVMLINLAGVFFWMFLADSLIPEEERMEAHIGMLPCVIAWLATFIITPVLAMKVTFQKRSETAMLGCILAWGQTIFPASFTSSTVFWFLFSIIPLVLTALVFRMLWLTMKVNETRPIAIVPNPPAVNPLEPPR